MSAEIVLTVLTFLILLIYHVHLIYQVRTNPLQTSFGLTNHLRMEWVGSIMNEGRDLLAVQTMRNWIMASSFLASTSILIALGILNLVFKSGSAPDVTQTLRLVGTMDGTMWSIKLLILSSNFFVGFLNFALSIRYYNHTAFMINTPTSNDQFLTPDYVARALNHGTTHYTLGMRSYYLSVPLMLWLFGPVWMLAGAVIIIAVLYRLDRIV